MGYTDSLLADGEVVAMRSKQHPLALFLDGRNGVGLWLIAIVLLVASVIFNIQGDARNVLGVIVLILFVVGLGIFVWHWIKWINQDYVVTNRRILKVSGIVNKKSMDSSLEKINDLVLEENLLGRMLDYGDLDIVTASDVAIDHFRMLRRAKDFKKEMLDQKHALEQGDFYRPSPPIMASSPVQAAAPVPAAAAPVAAAAPPVAEAAAPALNDAAVTPAAAELQSDETAPAPPADEAAIVPAAPPALAAPAAEDDAPLDVTRTLARLADLRDSGAITSEEYEAKKAELLGRL